jgi:hypothetical protein
MGVPEVQEFIIHLASSGKVSASTQNQALSAVTFLYRHVLHTELQFPADTIPNSWCRFYMAAACASWNAFGCVSKILILTTTASLYLTEKAAMIARPCCPIA